MEIFSHRYLPKKLILPKKALWSFRREKSSLNYYLKFLSIVHLYNFENLNYPLVLKVLISKNPLWIFSMIFLSVIICTWAIWRYIDNIFLLFYKWNHKNSINIGIWNSITICIMNLIYNFGWTIDLSSTFFKMKTALLL